MSYGGQAGLNRPAVTFLGLQPVSALGPLDALPNGGATLAASNSKPSVPGSTGAQTTITNPSYLANSSVIRTLDGAVAAWGNSGSNPVAIQGERKKAI